MTRPPLPNIGGILAPILPALPAASLSTQPAIGVLPFLSPILRQRVQIFSATSSEPWLRLLSYDSSKASRLVEVVQSGRLDPHPVSGEVEVDWEYDAKTRYRRLDQETFQALVVLEDLELTFQLVYCVGDKDGGGDGWRVGELGIAEKGSDPFAAFGGYSTIAEAEKAFGENRPKSSLKVSAATPGLDDEDDGYWDRYDATPARSPVVNQPSPAPPAKSTQPRLAQPEAYRPESAADDDDYYAMYDDVQPAMDNHDPDEEVEHARSGLHTGLAAGLSTGLSSGLAQPPAAKPESPPLDMERAAVLLHPRPASSASSNGSRTVEKLEETAERQVANEFSVKKHVSRTIRSLWMLSQASGIDRDEFDRLVRTELEVLEMADNQDLS